MQADELKTEISHRESQQEFMAFLASMLFVVGIASGAMGAILASKICVILCFFVIVAGCSLLVTLKNMENRTIELMAESNKQNLRSEYLIHRWGDVEKLVNQQIMRALVSDSLSFKNTSEFLHASNSPDNKNLRALICNIAEKCK